MTRDPESRPSRRGWPLRTEETTTPAGTHDHGLPGWIKPALIGCGVAIIALAVAVIYLMVYILGKGQLRERQIDQTREQVREQICEVLDGLPEGGLLDLTRDRLDCGPGMPIESYPPAIQQELGGTPRADRATERPELPPLSEPPPPAPKP